MFTVDQVRIALVNEKLSEALYRLEQLAIQTGIEELSTWSSCELKGYHRDGIKLSDHTKNYRRVSVIWKTYKNKTISIDSLPKEVVWIPLPDGVSNLESFLGSDIMIPSNRVPNFPDLSVPIRGAIVDSTELESLFTRIRFEARSQLDKYFPGIIEETIPRQSYMVPDFSTLVPDVALADILRRRWEEANRTFEAEAYLSTVILLGSILEGVLLSKVEQDRPTACRAGSCPKQKGGTVPLPIEDWKLQDLIEVAHECGWLRKDVKAFSHVLRDYRNFAHPNKERTEGITLDKNTAKITWEVVSTALS
jgi:hypothetical protein